MANVIRVNPNAKHLNELTHRHSFNESIYSEPYNGRFVAGSINRLESNRPNPLSESASASNIYSGKVVTATRSHPQYFFPQNHLSHRDVYATTSSIASNGLSTEASSTRSSVYSDKTILNEQTPPSTPHLLPSANEQTTIKATNPNNTASNASGSHVNTQSNTIFTHTEVPTQQINLNAVEKTSSSAEISNSTDQSKRLNSKKSRDFIKVFINFRPKIINFHLSQSLKRSTKLQRL